MEVGRYSDYGALDRATKGALGVRLQLLEDLGRDLLRCEALTADDDLDGVAPAARRLDLVEDA